MIWRQPMEYWKHQLKAYQEAKRRSPQKTKYWDKQIEFAQKKLKGLKKEWSLNE